MSDDPWYRDGLRFECIGCGRCCTGEPGYVWVSAAETRALARALAMSAREFRQQYVRTVHERWSLIELPNGDCVFFDRVTRRCKVYDARPIQCRTWPFWHSNVRTLRTWQETCHACPGSGQGTLFSCAHIARVAAQDRD